MAMRIFCLCLVSGLFVHFEASAARRDARQHSQRGRIQHGVKSGELTPGEARRLRLQQRRVRQAEKRAESDGQVTGAEKQKLERMQDRASKNIYQQKHDDQKRESAEEEASH